MSERRFFYLTGKKLTGEATQTELEELCRLLEEDPEWRSIYQTLFSKTRDVPDEPGSLAAQQAYAAHFVKMQLAGQFEKEEKVAGGWGRNRRRIYRAAAFAVVVAAAGWWIYVRVYCAKGGPSGLPKNEVATRKGSRSRIVLPDGTLVWLNADSKIVYPDNFKGQIREVHLTGEAYFDVSRDASRPFIIHAGPIDVNVLGTSFNVRFYPHEKKVETLLLHGAIEVTLRNQHNRKILLQPNQKLSVPNDPLPEESGHATRMVQPESDTALVSLGKGHFQRVDSSNIETLWVDNKLAFETEPLEIVAADLERWYNVEVIIRNEKLKSLRFTGVFDNVRLQEVMEALKLTGGFNYSIRDNRQVIIY